LNRNGYSLIEAITSSAVLALACAYICIMSSYSNRAVATAFAKQTDLCRSQTVLERAKGAAFADLESAGELTVSEIDADLKKLEISVEGYTIHAVRSRFD
jgi:hypothetical protein